MPRVHLHCVSGRRPGQDSWGRAAHDVIAASAMASRRGDELVDDPERADLIVFVENRDQGPYAEFVRQHSIFKKNRERVFLYDPVDKPLPLIPGLYPSLPKGLGNPSRSGSFCYIHAPIMQQLHEVEDATNPDLLYSFKGSTITSPVRAKLLDLDHPGGLVIDIAGSYGQDLKSSVAANFMHGSQEDIRNMVDSYFSLTLRSKFVLCPRGVGVSSMRLFETMALGRVPVVISDDWLEPPGPRWDEFIVRVPESEIASIPDRLEREENTWLTRAAAAKEAWNSHYSAESVFGTLVDACLQMQRCRRIPESISRLLTYRFFLNRWHLENYARTRRRLWRTERKIYL